MPKKKTVRRGNNEGCIYKRSDGRWSAIVTLGYDTNGKRIRKTVYGNTRSEVAVKMTTINSEKQKGNLCLVKNDALEIMMTNWLVTYKRSNVCERTFERNLGTAKVHIFPHFGTVKPENITSDMIQNLFNKMRIEGYAPASIRKVKFLLNQFFYYAKAHNIVAENPVSECKVKSGSEHKEQTKEEYKAIPSEIRQRFMDAITSNETFESLCMTLLLGGLRIGEALALKWKDVDFNHKLINIDNAITQIPLFDDNLNVIARKTVISDTKTSASIREIPMPDMLVEVLQKWKRIRKEKQQETGISFTEPNDIVFSTEEGELRSYNGIRVMFDRLMKRYGLEKYHIHLHTLRHTYSTMLLEEGENPKVVQQLLGHKDVTTTLKTYNSVDRSRFKSATDKLEGKIKKFDGKGRSDKE